MRIKPALSLCVTGSFVLIAVACADSSGDDGTAGGGGTAGAGEGGGTAGAAPTAGGSAGSGDGEGSSGSGGSAGGDAGTGGSAGTGGTGGGSAGTTAAGGAAGGGGKAGGAGKAGAGGGAGAGGNGQRNFSTNRSDFGLGGDSRCSGAKVKVCENFESGSWDANNWGTRGTMPTVDGGQVARGKNALHIKVASTSDGKGGFTGALSGLVESKLFPIANNTYYGRAFWYFESIPTPTASFTYSHWTILAGVGKYAGGSGDKEIRVSAQMQNGKNLFGVGTDNQDAGSPYATGDWTNSDKDPGGNPNPVPTKQWVCIEWAHDGAKNETHFYWDDAQHPSLDTTETMHGTGSGSVAGAKYDMPTFSSAWVGFQVYQGGGESYEMWVDEIALDSARIGCVL